jgi:hypothetical protein
MSILKIPESLKSISIFNLIRMFTGLINKAPTKELKKHRGAIDCAQFFIVATCHGESWVIEVFLVP